MEKLKKCLICGGNGFIGHHLARSLKAKGYFVRVADIKPYEYGDPYEFSNENLLLDLRIPGNCRRALITDNAYTSSFDEVYQLAASMGGMGFIHSAECEILHNNVLINTNMVHACAEAKVPRYFYSSSVCIYPDMAIGADVMTEDEAYPAMPDNEYGWEKLFSERMGMAYGRKYGMEVRIARFQNCYGPEGTWKGGKEKAPAAISRKIATVSNPGEIEIWGDGTAVRSYTYIDDLVRGIYMLTQSNIDKPTNIGSPQYVSVKELVNTVAEVAKKKITTKSIPGPVGVESRNFSNERIYSTGWSSKVSLFDGIIKTYPWILEQVNKEQHAKID